MSKLAFGLGFATGLAIILTFNTNVGVFAGVLVFVCVTSVFNKLLRGD